MQALLAASLLGFAVGSADDLDRELARATRQVTRAGSLDHTGEPRLRESR